jgi:ATP-binding cassette, subfamily F, member 3
MLSLRSGQIVVKDLGISLGQREILSHAQFQLQVGKHYVLVGRNGIGKSSSSVHKSSLRMSYWHLAALLQAIATDQIPSIPQSLRVLLLGQTQSNLEEDFEKLNLQNVTVLEHVIRSDKKREQLLYEERRLSAAIDNAQKPTAAVFSYRQICHQRLEQRTQDARQIASRRSGARGMKARKTLIALEEEVKQSEAK